MATRLSKADLAEIYADLDDLLADLRASRPPGSPAPRPCLPEGGNNRDNAWRQESDFLRNAHKVAADDAEEARKEARKVRARAKARETYARKKAERSG